MSKALIEKISKLKRDALPSMGRWEIAQSPEPFSSARMKNGESFTLTVVVHQESYFVLSMRVSLSSDKESGIESLTEAVAKHQVLPEALLVRDEKLFDELEPVAKTLGFKIERVRRLRAIPNVLSAMSKVLKPKIT